MAYTFWENVVHRNDDIKHVGYDFRGNIFRKTLSNIFFNDRKRMAILLNMDDVYSYLVDHIKYIKKSAAWVFPKQYRDFN
jgi:hypothetical protein